LPNKNIDKPQREMTKRQLSHWQRETRMQRFIAIAGIIVVVAVLAMVGTGVYMNKYKPYQTTAIKVDGKSFSMDYYIDILAFLGRANGTTNLIQYFGDTAIQITEQNYFITREAARQFGIKVSDDEVKKAFETNKMPKNAASTDMIGAQLLQTKLKDYFDKNTVPATGDQRNVEAMFLESQTQVDEVTLRLNNVTNPEKFEDIAAQLSLESKSKEKRGEFGSVPKGVLPSMTSDPNDTALEDKVFSADIPVDTLVTAEDATLTKSLGYWLVEWSDAVAATTPAPSPTPSATPSPQVHVQAILLGSKEKALDIKSKLETGGEGNDFATLAKANSLDSQLETNSGDFGMQTKDDVKTKFGDEVVSLFFPDDPAQALPKNKVSDPVAETTQSTKGGVWLVRVSALENKAIEGESRTILITAASSKWQDQVLAENQSKSEVVMTDSQKSWAMVQAVSRAQQ
jgi:parvulin-like peptidyl-prolyl isomerase